MKCWIESYQNSVCQGALLEPVPALETAIEPSLVVAPLEPCQEAILVPLTGQVALQWRQSWEYTLNAPLDKL